MEEKTKENETTSEETQTDDTTEETQTTTMPDGFKERFRTFRNYLGYTQKQLAMLIDKTPGFISLVENGGCGMSEKTLQLVSETTGVNIDWLNTGEGEMFLEGETPPSYDKDNIGSRIRELRASKRMTISEFADEVGTVRAQIYAFENGTAVPSEKLLQRIADTFFVSYQWLTTGQTDNTEKEVNEIQKISQYLHLDSVARQVVLEAMEEDRTIWLDFDRLIREKKK